jgi:hypothetical protein
MFIKLIKQYSQFVLILIFVVFSGNPKIVAAEAPTEGRTTHLWNQSMVSKLPPVFKERHSNI